MIYTIEKAILIKDQLAKFTSGYTHHVVGQFANIDFWINEVTGALTVIDEYRLRFDRMYDAQKVWTQEHGTFVHEYCPFCKGKCEFSDGKPRLPTLKFKSEIAETRKELVDSAYFFLVRCYRIGLLTNDELKLKCAVVGTSVDPDDLK